MRIRSLSNALTVATATGSLVAATPGHNDHKHHHNHLEHIEKRDSDPTIANPVVSNTSIYEVDGKYISQTDVCRGIKNGSLLWPEDAEPSIDCSSIDNASTTVPALTTSAVTTPGSVESVSVETKYVSANMSSNAFAEVPSGQGLYTEFPDGAVDCSTFPSEYGPVPISWAQLGGWSGIQYVTISGNTVSNIVTGIPGDVCKPGAMCSYACPPGFQKSQWPTTQGSTGQSVGGLQCNSNGKLALTNPTLSRNLCIPGTGAAVVQNTLSTNAAICRTDYPGTEAEVIPLDTQPNSINNLTCPDASTYYRHEGAATSAQYYINNQGVIISSACTWGTDGTDMGNWAPSYLGVGQDTLGKTWLSIASTVQNSPSNYRALNYTVEIFGSTSGKCRLKDGHYCSGTSYEDCNDSGCTVSI